MSLAELVDGSATPGRPGSLALRRSAFRRRPNASPPSPSKGVARGVGDARAAFGLHQNARGDYGSLAGTSGASGAVNRFSETP